jgi:hypothetical protein
VEGGKLPFFFFFVFFVPLMADNESSGLLSASHPHYTSLTSADPHVGRFSPIHKEEKATYLALFRPPLPLMLDDDAPLSMASLLV